MGNRASEGVSAMVVVKVPIHHSHDRLRKLDRRLHCGEETAGRRRVLLQAGEAWKLEAGVSRIPPIGSARAPHHLRSS